MRYINSLLLLLLLTTKQP